MREESLIIFPSLGTHSGERGTMSLIRELVLEVCVALAAEMRQLPGRGIAASIYKNIYIWKIEMGDWWAVHLLYRTGRNCFLIFSSGTMIFDSGHPSSSC